MGRTKGDWKCKNCKRMNRSWVARCKYCNEPYPITKMSDKQLDNYLDAAELKPIPPAPKGAGILGD